MSNSKKILDSLEQPKGERVKTSLYLNQKLYKDLKKVCEKKNITASRLLEKLIEDFLNGIK